MILRRYVLAADFDYYIFMFLIFLAAAFFQPLETLNPQQVPGELDKLQARRDSAKTKAAESYAIILDFLEVCPIELRISPGQQKIKLRTSTACSSLKYLLTQSPPGRRRTFFPSC